MGPILGALSQSPGLAAALEDVRAFAKKARVQFNKDDLQLLQREHIITLERSQTSDVAIIRIAVEPLAHYLIATKYVADRNWSSKDQAQILADFRSHVTDDLLASSHRETVVQILLQAESLGKDPTPLLDYLVDCGESAARSFTGEAYFETVCKTIQQMEFPGTDASFQLLERILKRVELWLWRDGDIYCSALSHIISAMTTDRAASLLAVLARDRRCKGRAAAVYPLIDLSGRDFEESIKLLHELWSPLPEWIHPRSLDS
jgi:hypothetical protein